MMDHKNELEGMLVMWIKANKKNVNVWAINI